MQLSLGQKFMLSYKLNKYKEWWINLSLREQRIVMIGGIALVLFLIYALVLSPLYQSVTVMRQRLTANEKTLAFMQTINQEINEITQAATQDKSKSHSPLELISLLQNQIASAQLNEQLTQLKQTSKDSIEMHFQKVEFDKLCAMLIKISKTQNAVIMQVAVKRVDMVGHVDADVVIGV